MQDNEQSRITLRKKTGWQNWEKLLYSYDNKVFNYIDKHEILMVSWTIQIIWSIGWNLTKW